MKRVIFLILIVCFCYSSISAKRGKGERIEPDMKVPVGMLYIQGEKENPGFCVGQMQVSNEEYRKFVSWVRDSVLRERLSEGDFSYKRVTDRGDTVLNWNKKIPRKPKGMWERYVLKHMYKTENIRPELNEEYTCYRFSFHDRSGAERWRRGQLSGGTVRIDSVMVDSFHCNSDKEIHFERVKKQITGENDYFRSMIISVTPDTTCWEKIDDYSKHLKNIYGFDYFWTYKITYFRSVVYKNFPVVGISWYQAVAYCDWLNKTRGTSGTDVEYDLPTEDEWVRTAGKAEELARCRASVSYKVIKNRFELFGRSLCMLPPFDPARDYLLWGVYDLLLNTRDWTCTVADSGAKPIGANSHLADDMKRMNERYRLFNFRVLKGRSVIDSIYTKTDRFGCYAMDSQPFIGFRVVCRYKKKP